MTMPQESWVLMAAAALGGATVGFAAAIQIARSHSERRLRLAVKEADNQWAAVVARHRAERIQSELQLEEARISLGRLLKTTSDQAPSAPPRSQPKPPEIRPEGVRVNLLLSPFLGQESDDAACAFAETQPMYDADDGAQTPAIGPRRSSRFTRQK